MFFFSRWPSFFTFTFFSPFSILILLLLQSRTVHCAFEIGPFIDVNITLASQDWQPCYIFEASSYSGTFADIAALCPGPLAFGQTSAIDPNAYATYVRAYANVSISLLPPSSSAWGNYSFYLTDTALNYGTLSLTDCSLANLTTSIFCWNVNATNGTYSFAPGGFVANGDGYQTQVSITRVLMSAPCYGLAPSTNCSFPFTGLCGLGQCTGANSCDNTTVPTPPVISNTTCSVVGFCNPYNGSYSILPKADGQPCFYGNYCISNDACFSGVCVPGNFSNVCPLPSSICYQAPVCSSTNSTFICTYPLNDGTTCQADSNYLCRTGDLCNNGTCIPGLNVSQTFNLTTCALAYTCNSTTGLTTAITAPFGTTCIPTNPCFSSGICNSTICYGTTPAPSPIPTTDCLGAVCDPGTGNFTYSFVNTGLSCTPEGSLANDTCNNYVCLAGNCTYSNPLQCPALPCQTAECINGTGCVYTAQNGTSCGTSSVCNGYGICLSGNCTNLGALNCTVQYPGLDPLCGYTYCDDAMGCIVNATNIGAPCSSNPCVPIISSFCNVFAQCSGQIVPSLPGCFSSSSYAEHLSSSCLLDYFI